jgi:catechol 2,3-dioxygenase-like lactoylglutathione lyase family enzyme
MKRLHVHVAVKSLDESVRFYTQLFAAEPTVRKPDYAKWMLDDPRANFAISQRDARVGIQELGIQAESREELGDLYERLKGIERPVVEEGATTCCYSHSEKSWVADPQGQEWEIFFTSAESMGYDTDRSGAEASTPESDRCRPDCCSTPAA